MQSGAFFRVRIDIRRVYRRGGVLAMFCILTHIVVIKEISNLTHIQSSSDYARLRTGAESNEDCGEKSRRRGRAATSFCVYACWGAPKICDGGPHSTISPAFRMAMRWQRTATESKSCEI